MESYYNLMIDLLFKRFYLDGMKRLSNGRSNMAGVGTNTRLWGGWSGWYSSLSPALYSTPESPNTTRQRERRPPYSQ